ncbi:AsmA family protein [Falsiruegeria litorea R37]|uniref:AsmA family protein n=1 Tax=Falsiruegeria litorea R37 TaxID=1200284 RepID=A0A1Y5SMZ7_9RHOB|nr:AsmA-like C-terminal region-containing protein [Falsiruegeria litorea]SLN44470.1 AsmA family protein [Falsiruegeria litorea R37]
MTKDQTPPQAKTPRRRAKVGRWTFRGVLILIFLASVTAVMTIGQTISAPDWVRERVADRIERNLNGLQLEFGQVKFIILDGWRPRISLQNVALKSAEGQMIAQLAHAEASLAMRPLLQGQVKPKQIVLSGAFVTMQRDALGNLSLSLGEGAAPVGQAANLPQMIETADQVFLSSQLSALTAIEVQGITLSLEDLGKGRAWTLDGGHIQLTRHDRDVRIATGFSLLSGRDYASSIEANYTSTLGAPEAKFGISVSDIAAEDIALQNAAVSWLEVLEAPISGAVRGGIDVQGNPTLVSATLQIGAGAVQPNPETRPIRFTGARTYFTYDPSRQLLDFNEFSVNSSWGAVTAEGQAVVNGVETGVLESLVGQLRFTDMSLNPAQLMEAPVNVDRAEVDLKLKLNPFRVQVGRLTVSDDNKLLNAWGHLAADPTGWRVALDGTLDRMTPGELLGYWPRAVAPKPREWVEENLTAGTFTDGDFAVRLVPGKQPDLYADFDFDQTTIRYAKTLPPAIDARGQASLTGQRFAVLAHAGRVITDHGDEIDAAGTSFIIPDISIKKAAPGIARIIGTGSVPAVLSLLDRPPLNLMSKSKLPIELAEGQVSVQGTLSLPLKDKVKIDDMEFHLTGEVTDVRSTVLVPGQELSAPRLAAVGDQTQITLSGSGFLGQVPMTAKWTQPIGDKDTPKASQVAGTIELSPQLMQQFNSPFAVRALRGAGTARYTLDLQQGKPPYLTAQSDLVGVGLRVSELGWSKPQSTPGELSVAVELGDHDTVETFSVQAAGLTAVGTMSFNDAGAMERAQFITLRVGNWLNVRMDMIGRGSRAPDMVIRGGTLDMRGAGIGGGGGGASSAASGASSGQNVTVTLDRLQITDSIALTGFQGNFSQASGMTGNFAGRINGQTPVNGQVLPKGGRSGFFVQSNDAGGVFRSAQLLNQARGGTMQLSLSPVGGPGSYDGTLRVRNTQVKDAPAMAALLNAISVVGLLDEMAGAGIQFASIDGRFRVDPDKVTVYEGSAVGPSMGLSVDGTVDTEQRTLNLRGVISPVYLLNVIGSVISTRKGEGLVGFNYTLTGSMTSPQVWVNPLSGLAPGFLRDFLREPAPKAPPVPGQPPVQQVDPTHNSGAGDR